MDKFLRKLVLFTIPILVFIVLGLFLPATPRVSKSLLFSSIYKDELLLHAESPRMIFVGGSNLSFGLDSKTIKDRLSVYPINTGVHASVGVRYMLENTIQYLKEGDIVVLALEYNHFYRDYEYGSEELLRAILDVAPSKYKLLNMGQVVNLVPYLPKYSLSKFKPTEYIGFKESDVYSINSFNEFGDVYKHWELTPRTFSPYKPIPGELNIEVIQNILTAQEQIQSKNATLLITYPGFQDASYENSFEQIEKVEDELEKNGFMILGYPERYKMPSEMMFDTPYHLTKEGVDLRTRLFIEDYLEYKSKQGT